MDKEDASDRAIGKPHLAHVSGDFPDPFGAFKTPVIRRLVDLTSDSFDHYVISVNRRKPSMMRLVGELLSQGGRPSLHCDERPFAYGTALAYEAPGKGLFHATMLRQLGDRLAGALSTGPRTELLVAHKLSIEGIAVRRAAHRLGIPYAVCVQGDTDTKIIAARPDLRRELRAIYHEAAMVFPFAPWTRETCEQALGQRRGPSMLLPCPTEFSGFLAPQERGDGLVTVFHLKNRRRKNLRGLALAVKRLEAAGKAPRLAVIGGGINADLERCAALTRGLGSITYEGALASDAMQQRMNRATGLVLPSLRESFGLVFVEALFAGLPIIYPKGAAVDGYFDGCSFAIAVDAKDPADIAAAIARLVRDEAQLKAELLEWQQSAQSERFTTSAIARTFTDGLNACLAHR